MPTVAQQKKVRLKYFDVAKALAIIAVVTGHSAIRFLGVPTAGAGASTAIAATFTFHLPLFFFVSGYFLHPDRPFSLTKESRSLLFPYTVTAACAVIAIVGINHFTHGLAPSRELLVGWASAAVYGAGDVPVNPLWHQTFRIGAIWFLLAMFWARLFTLIACRARKAAPLVVITLFFLGLFSARAVFLPFSIQPAMCATAYVWLGTVARQRDALRRIAENAPIRLACLAIWIWAIAGYNGWGMAMSAYGNTPVDIARNLLGGLASTLTVLPLCARIEARIPSGNATWGLMAKIGTMTLTIMCVHLFEDLVMPWVALVPAAAKTMPWTGSWMIVNLVRIVVDILAAWAITRGAAVVRTVRNSKS